MTTADRFNVLVVCTGNVNRSALGAVLLDTWSGWYLPDETAAQVDVTSAGLRAPEGSSMGSRARVIAEALGADGSAHRARQISEEAIRAADLVLVSSARQRDSVLGLVPAALRSTFTIREAGRIAEQLGLQTMPGSAEEMRARVAMLAQHRFTPGTAVDDDILDPQGKDDDAYRLMVRMEIPPLAALAGLLFGMPEAEILAYGEAAETAAFPFGADDATNEVPTRAKGRREA
ncbi:protein-tyrosine phosphatase [Agromyces ramosus]|uniref:Protein-tyrosine phosphatase n=1 Tax=Agromyces ramosus TaxID=33879 RepID=A0A4V2EYM0_9MICO|nr:hypothetical protein [Agromyces ramosus]RZS63460.1 protein-tyrosine phosphatase [Agromyces ramosus]